MVIMRSDGRLIITHFYYNIWNSNKVQNNNKKIQVNFVRLIDKIIIV